MTITEFNIASAAWFRPELVLTAGILLLMLLRSRLEEEPPPRAHPDRRRARLRRRGGRLPGVPAGARAASCSTA